jgi:acyl-coenzyme A synthetase/AMP-(fatty) acid ligase
MLSRTISETVTNYGEAYRTFRWDIPRYFNIGVDVCDRHAADRLAAYEYPRLIEFVEEIPTTTTGKIKRDELRQREAR